MIGQGSWQPAKNSNWIIGVRTIRNLFRCSMPFRESDRQTPISTFERLYGLYLSCYMERWLSGKRKQSRLSIPVIGAGPLRPLDPFPLRQAIS
jgi:hypothetical protein